MAGSLVSFVLNQLATITVEEVQRIRGVDAGIEKLTSNLMAIQVVLKDAERRQEKEATVKFWLERLKDVAYDIDDVLDEWTTLANLKLEDDEDAEKVWSFRALSTCFCYPQVGLLHDFAFKIETLNERLAAIANEKNAYNLVSGRGSEEPRTFTTSVIDVSEVFGREHDTKNIRTMLLSVNGEGETLRIISIVGMGGLGKTTLARLAFNDAQVEGHFDNRIWVCVSNPFDDTRIAKEILESLTGRKTDLDGKDEILKNIRLAISGKKILLVLDDVWTEDPTRWEALKGSLKQSASPASRILLTTRKERTAMVMGSRRADIAPVDFLSEEWCWKLFTHLAFYERPNEECNNLEDVGRRIVGKCKGLPLAVKTVGSMLRFKKSKEQWQGVLDSEMWENEEVEEGVFVPLLVSYYDLPSVLRQCFSFCAIFPEDYVIKKDELIKFWMAQGFLNEAQHKEMEIIGEEYFNELATRSFFQDFGKNENGDIVDCKMHDLVHSFVQFLTKKECFLVKVGDDLMKTKKVSLPFKTIRHSSVLLMGEEANLPAPMNNWGKVRTLWCYRDNQDSRARASNLLNSIDKLRCLRILGLGSCDAKITKKVGKLIHLRYLNISRSWRLRTLPEVVCDLYNLQTLDITECKYLRGLPRGMGKLKNLKHLENWRTHSLLFMPKGMKRLSGLRTLRELSLSSKKDALMKMEDMGNLLSNLQQTSLVIKINVHGLQKEEMKATLVSTKIGLRDLTLRFYGGSRHGRNEAIVVEAIQLPPSLQSLEIKESRGPNTLFPASWMTLTILKSVVLRRCVNWESLPPLGKLLSLESLHIWNLKKVKKVGVEFLGIEEEEEATQTSSSSITAFPKLAKLSLSSMSELEEWDYGNLFTSSTITIMPLLRFLRIRGCPKLKAVPRHLFNQLQELEIFDCPILSRRFEEQRGEDWPYISHIPKRSIYSQ